jgi:lipase
MLSSSVSGSPFDQSYYEWRPELRGQGPTLLMVHATGFHARLWDEIIGHLQNYHILSVDQRGHGLSCGGTVENWREFSEDLERLIEALDLNNLVGVGHSMGAHTLIDAAAQCQNRFLRLIAIDPVVAEPESYQDETPLVSGDEPHPASRRKNKFSSPEAMIERFKGRPPYSLFTEETRRNYCVHGLLPAEDGNGYVLACPPDVEANVYMTSRTNAGIFNSIAKIDIPVLIIRAKRADDAARWDFSASPTWPGLVDQFTNGREIYRPDKTHFLPMQIPEELAHIIDEEVTS